MIEHSMLVGGAWTGGAGRNFATVEDPACSAVVGHVPLAREADITAALESARAGFEVWRSWSPERRSRVLVGAARLLRDESEALARAVVVEQGKVLREALVEISVSAEILEWSAAEGMRQYGRLIPSRDPAFQQTVRREPVGVSVLIPSWNVPVLFVARKLGECLAAGCSAILVGNKQVPSASVTVVRALEQAGLPNGVVNLLFGTNASLVEKLLAGRDVAKVSFTGGTQTGRTVARLAADRVLRTTLELGGHAPAIVFDDVDVDVVARMLVASKFRNAGQVCNSPTRFYIQRPVYDAFAKAFVEAAGTLRIGSGLEPSTDMGPLCGERQFRRIEALVADAADRGARTLAGGRRIGNEGWFFEPTVLDRVADEARLLREEPFGPVAVLMPFDGEDEVIARANSLDYGLAGYAFTTLSARAHRISNELKVGMLGINTAQISLPETPFGGVGPSGIGSEGGTEGVAGYMTTKYVSHLAA
jgi:succinate-semialdehyde dehydrogenase/glutarate-semialdehyde dehydrogenase